MSGSRRTALASARRAAGYTQEALAEALHVERSTVIRWEAGRQAPQPYLWPKLGRLLGQDSNQLRALLDASRSPDDSAVLSIASMLDWLDRRAGWEPEAAKRQVLARMAKLDISAVRHRAARHARVPHAQLVRALGEYYGDELDGYTRFAVRCDGQTIESNIVVKPTWLDIACPLSEAELSFVESDSPPLVPSSAALQHSVRRLAEAATADVRMVDAPIYRLRDVNGGSGWLRGSVCVSSFAEYALTADLLEGELFESVLLGRLDRQPLRNEYLPTFASVVDLSSRSAFGGVLALFAIARPGNASRPADYLLLLQRRSEHVLNASGRLSVLPKGFHQPLTDIRTDAALSATLIREAEEELFGRAEVDSSVGPTRVVAPMHRNRLSEPMRWLLDSRDVAMYSTGFGLNRMSGNYEFAALFAINDESFWKEYAGHLEANWESVGLEQLSTQDSQAVKNAVQDTRWADEGLFAFSLGLRQLSRIAPERIAPAALRLVECT